VNDTHPQIERRYREMLLSKSGEERLLMGDSMYATARKLALASIKTENPTATPAELKCALFLRFYGHEFSEEERLKILSQIGVPKQIRNKFENENESFR
jgi:hypothetical protein